MIKTEYPHRFFILKRIAQNPEFWEICLHDNYYIITEEAYVQKIQNSYETSDNVYLIFMSVEQKKFLGYGQIDSKIKNFSDFKELRKIDLSSDIKNVLKAFRVKWISKNPVNFETVKFIRNELNKNSPINMCKEFHEVD